MDGLIYEYAKYRQPGNIKVPFWLNPDKHLLVCGADLQNDLDKRPAAAQFRQSLLEYMASDCFDPSQELKIEAVLYTK